ncbi:hypothetical protein C7M61_003831 [Candidozyma pseudohaemuli]|uniref:thioredoxin-dependent peroxiredoxin n=1 Tax=Candidozyma pseudohaemuli TaxID=418784 RepID=A0A2P7YLW6_9ASCO|nr:hypothetical protein C7M61_003831 [[Candida] pseudohaemulonii]PSK36966.1 hypothetical protein C7M61_003831 [[Candida] pseudohaemulonii]
MPPRRSARVASHDEPSSKKPKYEEPDSDSDFEAEEEAELEVGDELPQITLKDDHEKEVDVADVVKNNKYVVIFAYPKALTPGCTRQACGFLKLYQSFVDNNTKVYGLSTDSPKAQLSFVSKQGLRFPLLSDPERQLIGLLGAKKTPSGTKRSHWIFVDGKLAVKKVQILPEDSFTTALSDIEGFVAKNGGESKAEPQAEEPKAEPQAEEPEAEPKEEPQAAPAPEANGADEAAEPKVEA